MDLGPLVADLLDPPSRRGWRDTARPEQLPPAGWRRTWYVRGGRGGGKTWTGSHNFAEMIAAGPPGEWGVIAPTYGDARDTCIESEESGLLKALGLPRTYRGWNRSLGELRLPTGGVVFVDGADDGALRIQGKNLRGAWCDEVGLWKRWRTAWLESIRYAVRLAPAKIIATGTPKRSMPARALVKLLIDDPAVVDTRLRTKDNAANLDADLLAELLLDEGTTLGRQELEGDLLEDVDGALWLRDWLDHDPGGYRPETMDRVVVSVDPSDGADDSDEQGICVAAHGLDGRYYVLWSDGVRLHPTALMRHVADLRHRYGAGLVVMEKNHGGAFLEPVLRQVDPDCPLRMVTASAGKLTRAEPVATLYERGIVTHLQRFDRLEDQMVTFTGRPGERSPDRLDALVWALTELASGPGVFDTRTHLQAVRTSPDSLLAANF